MMCAFVYIWILIGFAANGYLYQNMIAQVFEDEGGKSLGYWDLLVPIGDQLHL